MFGAVWLGGSFADLPATQDRELPLPATRDPLPATRDRAHSLGATRQQNKSKSVNGRFSRLDYPEVNPLFSYDALYSTM